MWFLGHPRDGYCDIETHAVDIEALKLLHAGGNSEAPEGFVKRKEVFFYDENDDKAKNLIYQYDAAPGRHAHTSGEDITRNGGAGVPERQ